MGALHRSMAAFSILCRHVACVEHISTCLPTPSCLLAPRPQPLAVGNSADLSSSFFQVKLGFVLKGYGLGTDRVSVLQLLPSFFQMIDLLHARLHDAPNTPGTMAI